MNTIYSITGNHEHDKIHFFTQEVIQLEIFIKIIFNFFQKTKKLYLILKIIFMNIQIK